MNHAAAHWVPLFPSEEVPFILAAVLRCCGRLRKKHATEHENQLSDRLRARLDWDGGLKRRPVELYREVPLYDRRRARVRQKGRSDFFFVFSTGTRKPWPYFALEAKRLHVAFASGKSSLVSEYVTGEQGMMCFVRQRYSQGLVSGGMLGYVFDGEIAAARASVSAQVSDQRQLLKTVEPHALTQSPFSSVDAEVSETVHALPHGEFAIYHVFSAV